VPPHDIAEHCEEVDEATRMLKYDVIPTIAMHLQVRQNNDIVANMILIAVV
jgi:hypothetical protein